MNIQPTPDKPAQQARLRRPSPWMIGITLILAAGLLYLALRGIDWQQFLDTLRQAKPELLALAFSVLSFSYVIRGLRWNMLLRAEGTISILDTFWAVVVGYLGNYFLPARAGEVIRSALAGRVGRMSVSYVLATALTERLIDVVALVLLSLVALFWIEGLPAWLEVAVRVMAVVGLAGLAALAVLPRLEAWLIRMTELLPLPQRWRERIARLTSQFLLGMQAIQQPARALRFAGLTIVIWLLDALVAITTAAALQLTLSLPQALVLLTALGLASAAPSTPGYVGIFQFVAVTVLPPFGLTRSAALAFIVAFQGITYVTVTVWGLIGVWRLGSKGLK